MVKQGKVKLRFKAIFIDEVQIFDPLYLELCYRLLEDDDDRVFLMAGDLNQAVRALTSLDVFATSKKITEIVKR